MKYAVKYTVLAAAVLLSACALTPEQQAEREAARIRARQNLQVGLAAQCDPETARLMRRQFDGDTGSGEKERQAFRLVYLDLAFRLFYNKNKDKSTPVNLTASGRRKDVTAWPILK